MKKELTTAIKAAKKAGAYLLGQYNASQKTRFQSKAKNDFVTKHDRQSEKIILSFLQQNFDYNIVTEETGIYDNKSEYTWFVDPIDGTTNFIHKYPFFSVSIGLAYKDNIVLGVVYNPVYNELFYGVKGKGAFLNDKKIKVSSVKSTKDAIMHFGFGYSKGKELDQQVKILNKIKKSCQGVRRCGSAALDMCFVATGRLDGYYEMRISMYDIAAAKIIVEEAGGRVSMMDGKVIKTTMESVCATNKKIHNQLLKLLK